MLASPTTTDYGPTIRPVFVHHDNQRKPEPPPPIANALYFVGLDLTAEEVATMDLCRATLRMGRGEMIGLLIRRAAELVTAAEFAKSSAETVQSS